MLKDGPKKQKGIIPVHSHIHAVILAPRIASAAILLISSRSSKLKGYVDDSHKVLTISSTFCFISGRVFNISRSGNKEKAVYVTQSQSN